MIKTKLVIIYTLTLVALSACGKGSSSTKDGNAAARDIFAARCAMCHGEDGEGNPPGGMRAPGLKRQQVLSYTDEQLFERISNGTRNMPPFKNSLTEAQIKSLVRFIREEIQGHKPST
ncbi:MAG TPA: cytochrome c [Pyrinomonadaceae bacterium]|jgi:mono/diheme cytochrome c family protein